MEFIDLEPNILGICLSGEQNVEKAGEKMEQMLTTSDKLNLYLEIPDRSKDNEGEQLQRLKRALNNFSPFTRIAVVSHKSWIEKYAEVLASLGSTELKAFEMEEKKQAKKWISSKSTHRPNIEPGPGRPPKMDAPDQGQNQT